MRKSISISILILLLLLAGCAGGDGVNKPEKLILATTTSTYDSGLLHHLLPEFEEENHVDVDIISVGTGQAIETGKMGDCDIILVHARQPEDEFVAEGYGTQRWDVMYNDFVYLGPESAPAEITNSANLEEAILAMVAHIEGEGLNFVSRGDNSGTHVKESNLWSVAGLDNVTDENWYNSIGQGMGDTLVAANEMSGYTMADRGTYLSMKDNLPNLRIVYEGDEDLFNPYGIIPVNPEKHSHVKHDTAMLLVEFITAPETQEKIGEFGIEDYGQPLFFPGAR